MARAARRLGLFGDVLASGALAAVASVMNIAGVFVFARALEPAAFGLFSTCRRVVAFLAPLAGLNGHLAVSRYLGYHTSEPRRRSAVLAIAVGLLLLTLPTTPGIFFLLRALGARVAWVRGLEGSVWVATGALTAATAMTLVVFSVLRGLGHPKAANLQQLFFLTAVLALAVGARDLSVTALLWGVAASAAAVSIADLVWVVALHRHELVRPRLADLRAAVREATRYSLPRLADGPCQAALPLVGVLLAPAVGGLALAGAMHVSQTLVRMTEVAIVPLSVIFLPLAARQVRDGKLVALARQAQLIHDGVFAAGAHLVAQMLAWAAVLLHAAFGAKYDAASTLVLVTLPAILPYLVYAGFRSFIDGYSEKPVNFLHLGAALALVVATSPPLGRALGGVGLCLGYTLGVTLLGLLTLRYVHQHFGVHTWSRATASALGVASVLGLASWAAARAVQDAGAVAVFGFFALTQAGTLAVFAVFLVRAGNPAALHAAERLGMGRTATGDPGPRSGAAAAARSAPLGRPRVGILTSVHPPTDTRILFKQATTLVRGGCEVFLVARAGGKVGGGVQHVALPVPRRRLGRIATCARLLRAALALRCDVYHLHDPELLPVAVVLRLFTPARIVFDVHEDVRRQIRNKYWIPRALRGPLAALYGAAERVLLAAVHRVVVAEDSYMPIYQRWAPVPVRNYPTLELLSRLDDWSRPRRYTGRPHLVYCGTIARIRGAFEMLETTRILAARYPQVHLSLIGASFPEALAAELRERVTALGLESHVTIHGRLPLDRAMSIVAQCDVGLALLHPDPNYLHSLPTKMFEYMALRLPVVVSDFELWRGIVAASGGGVTVDPLSPPAVAEAVERLAADAATLARCGESGCRSVRAVYSWEPEGERLLAMYRQLVPAKRWTARAAEHPSAGMAASAVSAGSAAGPGGHAAPAGEVAPAPAGDALRRPAETVGARKRGGV